MEQESSISVGKLSIDCQLPKGACNADKVQKRFVRIAENHLLSALQQSLAPLDAAPDQVVFIKTLNLDMDIDLSLGESQIAELWAKKMTRSLLESLNSRHASNIAIFSNYQKYFSCALLDIARNRAHNLWYYKTFDGLWALPASAALRTALLNNVVETLKALSILSISELLEISGALTDSDAQQVFSGLYKQGAQNTLTDNEVKEFGLIVSENKNLVFSLDGRINQQAFFIAALMGGQSSIQAGGIKQYIECFVTLKKLQVQHPQSFVKIFKLISKKRFSDLGSLLSSNELNNIVSLSALKKSVLESLVEPLMPVQKRLSEKMRSEQNNFTWFGNALLLLPQILELSLGFSDNWPALKKQSSRSILHWLILCFCQGKDRFRSAMQDPLLRDFCGFGPEHSLIDIVDWFNKQLASHKTQEDYSKLENISAQSLTHLSWVQNDRKISVDREPVKGCWLKLQINDHLIDNKLDEELNTNIEAAIETSMSDYEYLNIHHQYGFSDDALCLLISLAQTALKHFAYRLPGFTDCSVSYLLQNFLGMSATLVREEQQIKACLSRVPMSVMLNMSGLNRSLIELPDFDQRKIQLLETA